MNSPRIGNVEILKFRDQYAVSWSEYRESMRVRLFDATDPDDCLRAANLYTAMKEESKEDSNENDQ